MKKPHIALIMPLEDLQFYFEVANDTARRLRREGNTDAAARMAERAGRLHDTIRSAKRGNLAD